MPGDGTKLPDSQGPGPLQIKIFRDSVLRDLTREVNDWFVKNPEIEILDILQNTEGNSVIISIFYVA